MRLRNRTRTGNICSQNIPWERSISVIDSVRPYFSMIHVLPCVALRGICQLTSGGVRGRQSAIGRDEEEQSKGRCSSSAGRCSRFAEAFQTADLSARKCLDELGVI